MSAGAPDEVRVQVDLQMVGEHDERFDVTCTLLYRSAEPYTVQALFDTGEMQVQWLFARDLLRDGLRRPTGQGDVTVWPRFGAREPQMVITLSSGGSRAFLEADRADIEHFLVRSEQLVPHGQESRHIDFDAWIAQILGAGRRDAREHQ